MSEPSSRELNEKIADIREWLVRIDTKVDFLNEVKHKAELADAKADEAKSIAEEAKQMSLDNREDIRDMKANTKWVWGTILTVSGLLISVGIAVFT